MKATQYQYLAPKEFLDSIVHSGTDALMLGCIDRVGQITYREAIAEQNARIMEEEK